MVYLKKITQNNITTFDKGWIIGFIEGEGSFTHQHKSTGRKYPVLRVAQKEKRVLEKIVGILGYGSVIKKKTSKSAYKPNQIYHELCFDCKAELEAIKDLCEGNIKSVSKNRQFKIWKSYFGAFISSKIRKKKCDVCNRIIIIMGNNHKHCKVCAYEKYKESKRRWRKNGKRS